MAERYCDEHNCIVTQETCPHCGEKHLLVSEVVGQ